MHHLYREGPELVVPRGFPSCASLWSDLRLSNSEGKPAGGKWQFSRLGVETADGGSGGIFRESRSRCGPQDVSSFLLACAGRGWPVWSTGPDRDSLHLEEPVKRGGEPDMDRESQRSQCEEQGVMARRPQRHGPGVTER